MERFGKSPCEARSEKIMAFLELRKCRRYWEYLGLKKSWVAWIPKWFDEVSSSD
jgi:hypothetical protein